MRIPPRKSEATSKLQLLPPARSIAILARTLGQDLAHDSNHRVPRVELPEQRAEIAHLRGVQRSRFGNRQSQDDTDLRRIALLPTKPVGLEATPAPVATCRTLQEPAPAKGS